MATDKPRYSITVDDELFKKIENHRYKERFQTRTEATLDLIKKGIDQLYIEGVLPVGNKEHPMLKKYSALDAHGTQVVDALLDAEYERVCQENDKLTLRDSKILKFPDTTPCRTSIQSASAGTGTYLGPEEFETINVLSEHVPRNLSFCVPVSGDSMEPYYCDGDILIVSTEKDLRIGDIGIFTLDNEGYVKKLGEGELISLNPAYPPIRMNESIVCNGKVIGVIDPDWIVD